MVDQTETAAGPSSSQSVPHLSATEVVDDITKQEDLVMNEELPHTTETREDSPPLSLFGPFAQPTSGLLSTPLTSSPFPEGEHISEDVPEVTGSLAHLTDPYPLITIPSHLTLYSNGHSFYHDRDMDEQEDVEELLDHPAPFVSESANDETDDGWQEDQWIEPPDGNGSLIEISELSGFELDRLPHDRVGTGPGSISTSSEKDGNDATGGFYPSEDEDSCPDSESICGNVSSLPAAEQEQLSTNHDISNNPNNTAIGPITPPVEQAEFPPIELLQFALPDPGDHYFDPSGVDSDMADMSMHTESALPSPEQNTLSTNIINSQSLNMGLTIILHPCIGIYTNPSLSFTIPTCIPFTMVPYTFRVYSQSILPPNHIVPDEYTNKRHSPAFERNLTVEQFIRQWYLRARMSHDRLGIKHPYPPIASEAMNVQNWQRPTKISRPDDHKGRNFDIQNIPWTSKLNVDRAAARSLRDQWYTSYHNLRFQPHGYAITPRDTENYFKAKNMYTKFKATMAHFQLRNLMSVRASNVVQYVYRNKVYSVTPFYDVQDTILELTESVSSNPVADPLKISTMKAKHGVTVVGGFSGEYAYKGEIHGYEKVEGRITKHLNGITNHIDIVQHRTSHTPQAIIASNDNSIRILDCETNKFIATHRFARAINCTDTSPDGRLRVIVGDSADSWVVDSETGKPVQPLAGHRDYGFACAWSPDMLHIATSNQDKTVNIWDARMWRILQTLDSDVAGYRSLRFSPVGGGPRTLLMCEPADRFVIVNAQNYQTRQVHEFFGEIGGADFTPDGGRIWLSNMDSRFGGLMEFDRIQWGQEFGIGHTRRAKIEARGDVYYPDLPNEWLPEAELDDDPRCVLSASERRIRYLRLMSDAEFSRFNIYLG
ncbi:WD repeat protein [Trichophyton rubrum]|uniref:WD repeat protein n=1 Tax=Trichophyton rubrum TaxID=5551 RepID=A0A178EW54_TRIRU|nr:WD40-repeat-containing domain [Trichophyton rubrum]OAL64149.1 WD repeat protein [Trichophyton rubrum]